MTTEQAAAPPTSPRWATVRLPRQSASRNTDRVLFCVLLFAFALSSVAWDIHWRHGQPYDIDESGYLGIALADVHSLVSGGVVSWIKTVDVPSIQSPLTTALATPLFLIFGARSLTGLLVPLLLMLAAITFVYLLGRRIMSRRATWLATGLMCTAPAIVNYSRDYIFAAAAAAATACALYCFHRSDRLKSLGWSCALGVALGLMPLARTMTVSYLPAFAVMLLLAIASADARKARSRNALVTVVVAAATSATWLAPNHNYSLVWNYLTSYGYGSASLAYGQRHSVLSYAAWRSVAQVFGSLVYLPHFVCLAVGSLLALGLGLSGWLRRGAGAGLRYIVEHPLLPSALLVLEGFGALASSGNSGDGFAVPLIAPLCLLTGCAFAKSLRRLRFADVGIVVIVACIGFVPSLPWAWSLNGTWTADVPQLGSIDVASGQGIIQQYIAGGAPINMLDAGHMALGREWVAMNQTVAARLGDSYTSPVLVAFGFRHRLLNVNSVDLARATDNEPTLPLTMVNVGLGPSPADRSEYRLWLTAGAAAHACLLLTATGTANEFTPLVDGPAMVSAARAAGFVSTTTLPLPDGRIMTTWRRPAMCPAAS